MSHVQFLSIFNILLVKPVRVFLVWVLPIKFKRVGFIQCKLELVKVFLAQILPSSHKWGLLNVYSSSSRSSQPRFYAVYMSEVYPCTLELVMVFLAQVLLNNSHEWGLPNPYSSSSRFSQCGFYSIHMREVYSVHTQAHRNLPSTVITQCIRVGFTQCNPSSVAYQYLINLGKMTLNALKATYIYEGVQYQLNC